MPTNSKCEESNVNENEFFKTYNPVCNVGEMALRGIISSCTSRKSSVFFNLDSTQFDNQYEKLLEFINAASEPLNTQLAYIVYPLFVHFYLELVLSEKRDAARAFFEKYSSQFESSEDYRSAVGDLSEISCLEELKKHDYFKLFREDRFIIQLSEECLEYFLLYLKENNHTCILYLLNSYFSLESETVNSGSTEESKIENRSLFSPVPPEVVATSKSVESLKDVISRVREGPPCIPSVRLYKLSLSSHRLSSLALSSKNNFVAGGFEDSAIHIWNFPSEGLRGLQENSESVEGKSQVPKYLRGHGGPVYGMSFTTEGEHLFSCSADCTVRAWSLKNSENVAIYTGHCYPIWDIDVSSLSLYFATASKDLSARLWVTERMYPLQIYVGHSQDVNCVKFHPNCNYVATGSSDQTLRLWSVQSGLMVRLFAGHVGSIHCLAFSPNGQYLASAGEDRIIRIWDIGMGCLLKELHGHSASICSLNYNDTNTLLASAGRDNTIKLWDSRKLYNELPTQQSSSRAKCENPSEMIASFQMEPSLLKAVFSKRGVLTSVCVS